MSLTLWIRKVLCGFARENPATFSTAKGTGRANSKTSSTLCLLGMDSCGHQYDYQWGPLFTKYLKCDARTSTLLPETLDIFLRKQHQFFTLSHFTPESGRFGKPYTEMYIYTCMYIYVYERLLCVCLYRWHGSSLSAKSENQTGGFGKPSVFWYLIKSSSKDT